MFEINLGKARRLKQAKEEAQAEIEKFKVQREQEFQAKVKEVRYIPNIAVSRNQNFIPFKFT